MKSTVPVVLALLFALSAIIVVGALSFVSASPPASTSPIIPEFPLVITAAAIVALVVAGAVVAFKHGLIKIHEVKTDNMPVPMTADNNLLKVHPEWFCRYCGAEIAFSGQYCDKCGMHLS
jgi:hypothetical protein